jgi:hypothetical protein
VESHHFCVYAHLVAGGMTSFNYIFSVSVSIPAYLLYNGQYQCIFINQMTPERQWYPDVVLSAVLFTSLVSSSAILFTSLVYISAVFFTSPVSSWAVLFTSLVSSWAVFFTSLVSSWAVLFTSLVSSWSVLFTSLVVSTTYSVFQYPYQPTCYTMDSINAFL